MGWGGGGGGSINRTYMGEHISKIFNIVPGDQDIKFDYHKMPFSLFIMPNNIYCMANFIRELHRVKLAKMVSPMWKGGAAISVWEVGSPGLLPSVGAISGRYQVNYLTMLKWNITIWLIFLLTMFKKTKYICMFPTLDIDHKIQKIIVNYTPMIDKI